MSVTEGGADSAEHLAYEVIRRLWPLHRTVVRAVERELAGTGLTAGQRALLDTLRTHGPRTVPELARALDLDRQPVQRWVNHAADLGFLEAVPNPAHRRSPLIRLTPEGTEVTSALRQSEAAGLRRVLAGVPAADVATALHVLDRLGEDFRALARDEPAHPGLSRTADPPREPRAPRESRSPREPRTLGETREPREPQTLRAPREPQTLQAPQTSRGPRTARTSPADRAPHPTAPPPHTGRHGA
ncbi:MarR family winged helix-turn-helix transcriptional regulator [Streptomyces monomycini]|uniref:MarR family winged helix-turn-helix transcriptional regulator n=1 Tax=Streptomyces monomycini TaxID=371720 RepID=UPI000AB5B4BA|nr:MarR family transcriptional regulator [Streptomyces monomycini]